MISTCYRASRCSTRRTRPSSAVLACAVAAAGVAVLVGARYGRDLQMAARAARQHTAGERDQHREPLSADWILQQMLDLPISTWSYDWEPAEIVRCGVMAQTFHRAYGFGSTDKRIPTESALGVLMVCVQVLARRLTSAEQEIAALRAPGSEHQPPAEDHAAAGV